VQRIRGFGVLLTYVTLQALPPLISFFDNRHICFTALEVHEQNMSSSKNREQTVAAPFRKMVQNNKRKTTT